MRKRLIEWEGDIADITIGKVYEVYLSDDGEEMFLDDDIEERFCENGTWEDVGLMACVRGYYDFPRPARCLRDVIHHLNYNRSNAIKYVYRAGYKDPKTIRDDLEKAIECLQDELRRLNDD